MAQEVEKRVRGGMGMGELARGGRATMFSTKVHCVFVSIRQLDQYPYRRWLPLARYAGLIVWKPCSWRPGSKASRLREYIYLSKRSDNYDFY